MVSWKWFHGIRLKNPVLSGGRFDAVDNSSGYFNPKFSHDLGLLLGKKGGVGPAIIPQLEVNIILYSG